MKTKVRSMGRVISYVDIDRGRDNGEEGGGREGAGGLVELTQKMGGNVPG